MSDRPRQTVVVTSRRMNAVLGEFLPRLNEAGWTVRVRLPKGQGFTALELAEAVGNADALIIGDDEASAEFFDNASESLTTLIKWGVGVDSVNQEAAQSKGVRVRNTPGAFGSEVADLAMGYVVALARRIFEVHQSVDKGGWGQPQGQSLSGKTLSIVGFGDIGRQLARRAEAFDMSTAYYDPYVTGQVGYSRAVSMNEAFIEADFLALTCPSTPETRGIASEEKFSLMKPGAMLVNVARGDLVDELALADALRSGQVGGAALDVFQAEPLPGSSKLRGFANVILGSHNASNTLEATMRASGQVVEMLLQAEKKGGQ